MLQSNENQMTHKAFNVSKLTPTTHFNFQHFFDHVQAPAVSQLFFSMPIRFLR